MQEFAREFYQSAAWKSCRETYRRSKGHLCEKCLAKGIYRPGEIVHHKTFLTPENINDPDVALNPDNLELLCRDHHADAHKPERRFRVDELGRVTAWDV